LDSRIPVAALTKLEGDYAATIPAFPGPKV
jgi:hypothetical protein